MQNSKTDFEGGSEKLGLASPRLSFDQEHARLSSGLENEKGNAEMEKQLQMRHYRPSLPSKSDEEPDTKMLSSN